MLFIKYIRFFYYNNRGTMIQENLEGNEKYEPEKYESEKYALP